MKPLNLTIILCVIVISTTWTNASALTMEQFKAICDSSTESCTEQPLLQAYVGGSLDVLAALDEETVYLKKLYCEDASTLFNVKKIITFMLRHQVKYTDKNATLLVVRYLEENGGC